MENNEKNNLSEQWETPEITVLDINKNTQSGGFLTVDGSDIS